MSNKFFSDPSFDTLESIEIPGKFFYLTGNFLANGKQLTKADFAQEIINHEGKCQDLIKKPRVKPSEIDYLVIGEKGYHQETHGKNYKKIKEWNSNSSNRYIPIIKQSHCEELIIKFQNTNKPPTQP